MKVAMDVTGAWYQFDTYRFDPHGRVVLKDQKRVLLTPKAADTLRVLLEHAGELVSTEKLMREVWPASVVEPGSLTRNIADLRRALGSRRHIETVPKRGYRFVTPVSRASAEDSQPFLSVDVYPFDNLGDDHSLDSLRLAIASTLVTKLSAIRECKARLLRAVSLESGDKGGAPASHANAGVGVHATIQRSEETIRMNVTLESRGNAAPVWSESLEYGLDGPGSVAETSAEEIAGAVALWLSKRHRKLLARRYTGSAQAYKRYLRGHYYLGQRSRAGLEKAIGHFRESVELDSEYALAYAGLAASYALLPMLGAVDSGAYMPKARIAALNALESDETLTDAHAALAFVKWHYEWDWAGAERQFRRILKFHPGDAMTRQWLGLLLVEQGRFTEAIEQAARAVQLAPNSAGIRANLATVLLFAGREGRAAEEARHSLRLDPASVRAQWVLANALLADDQWPAAVDLLETASRLAPHSPMVLGALAYCYGKLGRAGDALSVLRRIEGHPEQNAWAYARVLSCLGLNRENEALECLKQAQLGRDFQMILLKVDRRLNSIRQRTEFQLIAKAVGLPA